MPTLFRSDCPRVRWALSHLVVFPTVGLIFTVFGCGGASQRTAPPPNQPPGVPQFSHVVLLVEENHDYSEVVGNSDMPYLNSLITQYGLATQYYANVHPSIGNYFMLSTGQVVTTDDAFSGMVDVDNIVRELTAQGKSWKSYAESLPSDGYVGGDSYPYAKRHNPFAYLKDVINSSSRSQTMVGISEFNADVSNGTLPNFSFVAPNLLDDAHDGPLQLADEWLRLNIDPLISSASFRNDGLLIIVFDEAGGDDSSKGGGRVPAIIISSKAKQGYQSTTVYQHQSTLRLIMQALGVTTYPGAAANAPEMGEFF